MGALTRRGGPNPARRKNDGRLGKRTPEQRQALSRGVRAKWHPVRTVNLAIGTFSKWAEAPSLTVEEQRVLEESTRDLAKVRDRVSGIPFKQEAP